MKAGEKKILSEPESDYHLAEDVHIKKILLTSHTERFHAMTRLMKLDILLKSAKITHKK